MTCEEYPGADFPWNFYFNGKLMPRWGACWGMAEIANHLRFQEKADQEVGDRDTYLIYCRIDHVGVPESADVGLFVYAVQSVLKLLLVRRGAILESLEGQSPEIYPKLLEAAFQMRQLAVKEGHAFWTSGYEADRLRLVEAMRRCQLPPGSPDFRLPPHVERQRSSVKSGLAWQARELHQLAQSGQFNKETRRQLHQITAP